MIPVYLLADAARLHGQRSFLQIQRWKGNTLNPLQWGWKKTQNGLMPIAMTIPPAPQSLLQKISCGCLKGCNNNCGCRKNGIKCSIFCRECAGTECENANVPEMSQEDVDNAIEKINTKESNS